MFWDKAASLYDFFEVVYNGKCYKNLPLRVAEMIGSDDQVLECACGTGIITQAMGIKAKSVVATDFSEGMLKQARKKCSKYNNVKIQKADITHLPFDNSSFDVVVAGNVIHLLDNPKAAMDELVRVCRPSGVIIIPTYVNIEVDGKTRLAARMLEKLGVNFKREFNLDSYREFFSDMGYDQVEYNVVEGRMPCAIAKILINNK